MGMAMERLSQLVGDTYLDYRVRKLIDNGKLEYSGQIMMLRDFEIRLKS